MQRNSTSPPETRSYPAGRVLSLDALRGFDMIWILGLDEFLIVLHKKYPNAVTRFLAAQVNHANWTGLTPYDIIFPLFVFIVGVSVVLSLSKIIQTQGRIPAVRRVVTRTVLLYILGLLYYGGLSKTIGDIRLLGVLQRIALCYLFAGLGFIFLHRPQPDPQAEHRSRTGFLYSEWLAASRWLVLALVALLIIYWALMTFVPVPRVGAGKYTEGKNLANYIDKKYLPLYKWDGDHDPEGLLSTLPAIGTCLMGVLAGVLLKQDSMISQKKALWLMGAGLVALIAGYLWSLQFPIIKKIWTSSYVLAAGGYSMLLLAFFYQVIDVWRLQKWAIPFVWVGTNAITLYLAVNFINFKYLSSLLVGGPVEHALGHAGEPILVGVAVLLVWLLGYFLYRRKVFIRL
jgi:predicted acyltransferase